MRPKAALAFAGLAEGVTVGSGDVGVAVQAQDADRQAARAGVNCDLFRPSACSGRGPLQHERLEAVVAGPFEGGERQDVELLGQELPHHLI